LAEVIIAGGLVGEFFLVHSELIPVVQEKEATASYCNLKKILTNFRKIWHVAIDCVKLYYFCHSLYLATLQGSVRTAGEVDSFKTTMFYSIHR